MLVVGYLLDRFGNLVLECELLDLIFELAETFRSSDTFDVALDALVVLRKDKFDLNFNVRELVRLHLCALVFVRVFQISIELLSY